MSHVLQSRTWHPLTALLIETLAVIALEQMSPTERMEDEALRRALRERLAGRTPIAWAGELVHAWEKTVVGVALLIARRAVNLEESKDRNSLLAVVEQAALASADSAHPAGLLRACAWLLSRGYLQGMQAAVIDDVASMEGQWETLGLSAIAYMRTAYALSSQHLIPAIPVIDIQAFSAVDSLSAQFGLSNHVCRFLYASLSDREQPPDTTEIPPLPDPADLLARRDSLLRELADLRQMWQTSVQSYDLETSLRINQQLFQGETELRTVSDQLQAIENVNPWQRQAMDLRSKYYDRLEKAHVIAQPVDQYLQGDFQPLVMRVKAISSRWSQAQSPVLAIQSTSHQILGVVDYLNASITDQANTSSYDLATLDKMVEQARSTFRSYRLSASGPTDNSARTLAPLISEQLLVLMRSLEATNENRQSPLSILGGVQERAEFFLAKSSLAASVELAWSDAQKDIEGLLEALERLEGLLKALRRSGQVCGPSPAVWLFDRQIHDLLVMLGVTPDQPQEEIEESVPDDVLSSRGIRREDFAWRRMIHNTGCYRVSNPDLMGDFSTEVMRNIESLRQLRERCHAASSEEQIWIIGLELRQNYEAGRELLTPQTLIGRLKEDAPLVLALLGRETEAIQISQAMLDGLSEDRVRPELYHILALLHFVQACRSPEDSEEQYHCWWRGVEHFAHLIRRGKREYWSWPAQRTMLDSAINDHQTEIGEPGFWSSYLAAGFGGGYQDPDLVNPDQRCICTLMMYTMAIPDGNLTALEQGLRKATTLRFVDPRLCDLSELISELSEPLALWGSAPISEKSGHLEEALTRVDQLDDWRSGVGALVLHSELPLSTLIGRLRRSILRAKEDAVRTLQSLNQEDIRRTFEKAGFSVHDTPSPIIFICVPTDNSWPQFRGGLPVLAALGRPLSVQQINDLFAARRSGVNLALAISDHRAPPSSWEHIRTYAAADGFRIMVEDAGRFGNPTITEQSAQQAIRLAIEPRADLFGAARDPVTGAEFFGRKKLLEDLRHQLAEGGRIVGLFGLRKMGKSSVLQMLAHTSDYPVVQVFLQSLERDEISGWLSGSFAGKLWEACERTLTGLGAGRVIEAARAIPQGNAGPLTLLSQQLKQVLDQLPSLGLRPHLLICLDEIEEIVPASQAKQESIDDYRQIAGTLRDLAENDGRVSILVAGLNTNVGRLHGWGTRQNPLYQKVQERWLRPMEVEDCREMIDYLSQRMGLDVEPTASEIAFEASGGWPFLARQLCSLAYTNLDREKRSRKLSDYLDKPSRDVFRNQFLDDGQRGSILNKRGLWGQIGDPATWGETGGPVSQQLLEVIASQDGPVSSSWLTKEIGKPKRYYEEALKALVERGVLSEDDGCYRITFELFQRYIRREVLDL